VTSSGKELFTGLSGMADRGEFFAGFEPSGPVTVIQGRGGACFFPAMLRPQRRVGIESAKAVEDPADA